MDVYNLFFLLIIITIFFIPIAIVVSIKQKRRNAEYLRKLSLSGIDQIDRMTGYEFEEYLKALYLLKGYKVTLTPGSGDYGADLILNKDKISIAIQAKRYSKPVGVKAVQEVIAAKSYYECSEAWVVSNSSYTSSAEQMASRTGVSLIDRKELVNIIVQNKKSRVNREIN